MATVFPAFLLVPTTASDLAPIERANRSSRKPTSTQTPFAPLQGVPA
jgi:hypothetical protein